ncbi:hypothetical protein [Massilia sp. Root335]|uniref:hypothetical protein n=1 Tax=Massilia sp. Root335 TaxID=1736517 RepID=UPI0006F9FFBC|nr:hypothetical protein [Massilia sp. Root335]
MMLTALAILLAVGLTAALVSNRLNRHKIDELESARALARQRLQAASWGHDVEEVLAQSGVLPSDFESARRIIDVIPRTFGLANLAPPADLVLGDVMRVHVPGKVGVNDGHPAGDSRLTDPFTYDLIANLLAVTDKKLWAQHAEVDSRLSADEEALGDLIAGMTVAGFVQLFTPLVKAKR